MVMVSSYCGLNIFQNTKGQTAMDMNLELRDTDNVILSFDPARHTKDRQISRMLKISHYANMPMQHAVIFKGRKNDIF